jgi:hypothetical protein
MSFLWDNDPFVERLQHCAGRPWTLFEAQHQLDALVLQPLPLSADASRADTTMFVDFLASTFHRRLLHCFVGRNVNRVWSLEDLLKQTRPPSPQALFDALEQCHFWQIVLSERAANVWQTHPRLATLNNLGWTFEWVIQTLLERNYDAMVRRHVVLGEIATVGEIDVLALFSDGRSLLIECKSSSKGLTDRQLDRFVAKGREFPADHALLLIDTDDPRQMQQRMGQLGQAMQRAYGDASVGTIQSHAGSSVVCLREHLYVADTAGGITTTLQAVLEGTEGTRRGP